MNTLQTILVILIALSGFPIGKFIASQTKEELESGKKWFKLIIVVCMIGLISGAILIKGENLILLSASLAFIFLIAVASLKG